MLQIFGLLMVVATIIAMFKRVESRLVLIVSGFIMAAASRVFPRACCEAT